MTENKIAKPFLKWAGGKTQLINDIKRALPTKIMQTNFTYIEPFVGSGAVLFWILNNFPNLKKAVINDINEDLINTYKTIASNPKELISILEILQGEFHALEGNEDNASNRSLGKILRKTSNTKTAFCFDKTYFGFNKTKRLDFRPICRKFDNRNCSEFS